MTDRPHLFVGIPSKGGKVTVELHRYLQRLAVGCATGAFPFHLWDAEACGLSPVHFARNVLCRKALETPAERVLMIDDDMLPDATVDRLLRSEADIAVARMYRFRHNGPDAPTPEENRPPEIAACATYVRGHGAEEERFDIVPEYDTTGAIEVQAAGTGCIMIRRRVLEDPRMLTGPADPDGTPALFRMKQTATGRITEWEDVDFTLRAHRLGYTVVADFGARCGHNKAINLDAVAELVHRAEQAAIARVRAEFEAQLSGGNRAGSIWLPPGSVAPQMAAGG